MFDEYPESKSCVHPFNYSAESETNAFPGSQAIATLKANEVPPAANPGFLGIDNGMDHNYYLQLAGRYAVLFHELWTS